jgi:hypothetical protein
MTLASADEAGAKEPKAPSRLSAGEMTVESTKNRLKMIARESAGYAPKGTSRDHIRPVRAANPAGESLR